jgi:predicted amidophosphoribosyltransferase
VDNETKVCLGCKEELEIHQPRYCPACREDYKKYMKQTPNVEEEIWRANRSYRGRDTFGERLAEGFRILNKT